MNENFFVTLFVLHAGIRDFFFIKRLAKNDVVYRGKKLWPETVTLGATESIICHVKKILITLFILCACFTVYAQSIAIKGMDSNPRLNEAESAYLQPLFPSAVFSFHDKHVGFKYLDIDTATGSVSGLYRVTKHLYFTGYDNGQHQYAYRLYLLNKTERKRTNGYEAVVLFTEKRFEAQLQKLKATKITEFFLLSYTEIPDNAGSDNNPVLNTENAAFFHALYKKPVPAGFDFYGKKIAILDTHDPAEGTQQKTIGEYVARVRESLLLRETYQPDVIYLLTEEQKKRSGGYDVIIQYRGQNSMPVEQLVQFLGGNK